VAGTPVTRAVVLGAGGPAGIVWEVGITAGLAEAGIGVRKAWPERALRVVAVDVESGARMVFDAASGVDFVDAVCRDHPHSPGDFSLSLRTLVRNLTLFILTVSKKARHVGGCCTAWLSSPFEDTTSIGAVR
jgi:hypothetical protein